MTEYQKQLSKKYVAYKTLTNLWFVAAVWLYFYRLFITDEQVGILDGMAFAIGLIAEVPSGALADKFGRDKLVKIGQVMVGSGFLIQAFGSSFVPFFVGQSIMMIGVAFASGADEALFFNKLNFSRDSTEWRKLVTRGSQGALLGSVLAIVAGGWLHLINPRIPWILTGFSFILSVLTIWSIREARKKTALKNFSTELGEYLHDIRIGFATFRLPQLRLYVPIILIVQGLFYTVGYGLLRLILLDRFQFDPFWGSVIVAISSIVTVGILEYMHKHADRMSEKKVITLISLSASVGLFLSMANIGAWGAVVILLLHVGEHTLQPFMSEILNNHAPEEQRATVLSVSSFMRTLPYILLAPIIGSLNYRGELEYFLFVWGSLIILATTLYLISKKRDEHIAIPQE